MCVTAIIAAATVVAAGVGAAASISAANARKKQSAYEVQMRNRQAYRERELSRIASLERENGRAEEFHRARSAALAAIGASGLGEHISFFQSIDPEAQKAYLRDVRRVRLNMAQTESSIADQVKVSEYRGEIERHNANMSKVTAISDFIQTAMSAANFYVTNSTPKPAKAG